ncbi:MAG: hypothetical protein RLZZ224_1529 [Verrucomicrobiota bacterium]|jgi:DNA-binding LytR/AlgR family response regulator
MRIVIVEDSLEDLLNLRSLLASMPHMHIVGVAHNLQDAREVLKEEIPDLVFLDIELGPENSFDLMDSIPVATRVIFTTVHTGYGAAAFDVDATDYVIKPVSEERLLRALAKLPANDVAPASKVLVYRGGSERHSLALQSIAAIVADRDHSIVVAGHQQYQDHRRFREWLQLLEKECFTQLDRSTLVHLPSVRSWQPYGGGLMLRFKNATVTLEIGRAATRRFEEMGVAEGLEESE